MLSSEEYYNHLSSRVLLFFLDGLEDAESSPPEELFRQFPRRIQFVYPPRNALDNILHSNVFFYIPLEDPESSPSEETFFKYSRREHFVCPPRNCLVFPSEYVVRKPSRGLKILQRI